jgi:hypothetical protein
MKIALWAIGGLIAIIVVMFGVGAYWATSVNVDFKDPATADRYHQTLADNCVATYTQHASKIGKPLAEDQVGKLNQACACARDALMPALAKREPMTAMQLASVISSDPDLKTIAHGCFAQAGIEDNL